MEKNRILVRFLQWSLPTKLAVSSIISLLAGSSAIGAALEYATHSYAINYGFRPPVEGLPFLRTAIAASSAFLLIAGALVATLSIAFLRVLIYSLTDGTKLKKFAEALLAILMTIFALLAGAIVVIPRLSPEFNEVIICGKLRICDEGARLGLLQTMNGLPALFSFILLAAAKPQRIWWISAVQTLSLYLTLLVILFIPSKFAALLRSTGFGGGLSVEVSVVSGDQVNKVAGNLMLRTETVYILYDAERAAFHEYDSKFVSALSYPAGGLHNVAFRLPE